MGEIEKNSGRKVWPKSVCDSGFYGSYSRPGDLRQGQWKFRCALVLEAPEIFDELLSELIEPYASWYESEENPHENWMPYMALANDLDYTWNRDHRELDLIRAIVEWAERYGINYEWVRDPAMYEVGYAYRSERDGRDFTVGLFFSGSENVHSVPVVPPIGSVCVELGKWDPQAITFREFAKRVEAAGLSAFKDHLRARLREHRQIVEVLARESGLVERKVPRQSGELFRPFRWLVRHIVFGETVTEIASGAQPRTGRGKRTDSDGVDRSTVGKAIFAAARECGIDLG